MATYIYALYVSVVTDPTTNQQTSSVLTTLSCNGYSGNLQSGNVFTVNQNDHLIITSYGYDPTDLEGFVLPNTQIISITNLSPGLFDIQPSEVSGISSLFFGIFSAQLGSDYAAFTITGTVGDAAKGGIPIPWTSDPKISIVAPN